MDVMAGIPWELKCPKVRGGEGLGPGWLQRVSGGDEWETWMKGRSDWVGRRRLWGEAGINQQEWEFQQVASWAERDTWNMEHDTWPVIALLPHLFR